MWFGQKKFEMVSISKISAVYFGLMQNGYEFYLTGKDPETARLWDGFRGIPTQEEAAFFRGARQVTRGIYPYWPRASALEVFAYHFDPANMHPEDFDAYHQHIEASDRLRDLDRDRDFWHWVREFPKALTLVMRSEGFSKYLVWESNWILQQALAHSRDIKRCRDAVSYLMKKYALPFKSIVAVMCPLKCAFATDSFVDKEVMYVISGEFRVEAILHEFLHLLVYPLALHNSYSVSSLRNLKKIDSYEPYFEEWNDPDILKIFEEYAIRELVAQILDGRYKIDLEKFIASLINTLA